MDQRDEIAAVAYQIYVNSGRIEGRDEQNWLEAERIVLSRKRDRTPPAEMQSQPSGKPARRTSKKKTGSSTRRPRKKTDGKNP
jgi:hypothetical protein